MSPVNLYAEIYPASGRLTGRQPQTEMPDGYQENPLIAGQWVRYGGETAEECLTKWGADLKSDYPET